MLMRRMREIVPTEDDWQRVLWRNRTSPLYDRPCGYVVGRLNGGGDFVRFNPWTDKAINDSFEYEWQKKHLPNSNDAESLPPGQTFGFDGWKEGEVGKDLAYWDVRLNVLRPYEFPPLPVEKPSWLARNVIRAEILVFEFYSKKSVPKPNQANPILEEEGRVGEPLGYVPPISHRAQ